MSTPPRWDLSNVFPSLASVEYEAAIEKVKHQLDGLEKLFSERVSKTGAATREEDFLESLFTASTHMAKPMTWASIGSLVTRLSFLVKARQVLMNSAFSGVSTDWK